MRLAVEVTTCTAVRAGIGYYTEHLVDALLATRGSGDEVVLLSNRPPAPELAERWAPYLRVSGGAVRAIWLQADAPRMLAEAGADVGAFPNYVVPLSSPCPTISFVHDLALLRTPELFTWRKRAVTRALLGQSVVSAAAVATVSQASRRDIVERLGVNPDRVVLLPGAAHPSCGPVPAEDIAAVRARHRLVRPYVLTVGTIEPRKNLPMLLEAFDRVLAEGPRVLAERPRVLAEGPRVVAGGAGEIDLVVVGGRGWRDRHLLDELEARTARGRVHWLGYVPEADLIALYGGAHLFVYPSRLEGFGLPVLEAMSCGAPVVASDVEALREVAADAARFVPSGDAVALGDAIVDLLAHPERADEMRARGFARAREFSWTTTAARLWEVARRVGPAREVPPVHPRSSREARATAPPMARARFEDLPGEAGRAAELAASAPPASPIGEPPPGLQKTEWALLAAVTYADLFNAPLPLDEAGVSCIGATSDVDEIRRATTQPALAPHVQLHWSGPAAAPPSNGASNGAAHASGHRGSAAPSNGHAGHAGNGAGHGNGHVGAANGSSRGAGCLVLSGRDELVRLRQQGVVQTTELIDQHRHALQWLATIPFVRMLAFSGGTAHQNPGHKPDIDLFVVTAPGRLYTAYTLIFLLTKLTRTRGVVCPNYLIDESELLIAYHHDLFTAHQLISARAVSGRDTYLAFCDANERWVRPLYPGFRPREVSTELGRRWLQRLGETLLAVALGPFERMARWAWRFYLGRRAAKARAPDVVLADGILKLHLSDYRRRVLDRFASRLDSVRSQLADGAAGARSAESRPDGS